MTLCKQIRKTIWGEKRLITFALIVCEQWINVNGMCVTSQD